MTFLAVALFGAGLIFIGSALDNTPILATIGKILNRQELDWTGGGSVSSSATTPAGKLPANL